MIKGGGELATPLADFAPDALAVSLAAELGLGLAMELASFRDYYSARGAMFVDWQAAFRGWLRNAAKFAPRIVVRRDLKEIETSRSLMAGAAPEESHEETRRDLVKAVAYGSHGVYAFILEFGDPDMNTIARQNFEKQFAHRLIGADKWEHWKDICAEEGVEPKPVARRST